MKYHVELTEQAQADINAMVRYIAVEFAAPQTASKKYNLIMDVINNTLSEHPFWQHAYRGNPWRGRQLYIYNVDHYRVIHLPDKAKRQTTVVRVLHQLQNLETQLGSTR